MRLDKLKPHIIGGTWYSLSLRSDIILELAFTDDIPILAGIGFRLKVMQ